MSKTLKFALSLMLIVLLALPMMTAQAGDNTVNPFSTDWGLVVETAGTNSATFVEGPATAPAGYGSLRMTVDGVAGIAYATQKYQGTRLADIESLAYSTYVTSGSGATAIAFQINYDPDLTDATDPKPWYGRLVYEPYRNGTVATGEWQTWDMLDGGAAVWWASNSANSPVDDVCGQNTPCTLQFILETWPNIGIRDDVNSAIQFKAGGSWAGGFDGNIDLLMVEIGGVTDTFDFEPYLPVHNITQDTKHATIQAGINAATAGDVLEIGPGTYVENVVVNKSITLRGAGAGTDPAMHTILDGSSFGTTANSGIRVNTNITHVTIEDLTVRNYTLNTSDGGGIFGVGGNNHLTVQRVHALNNTGGRGGVFLNGPVDTVLIDQVTAHNNTSRGIVIWNGFKTNITITNNDVRNNNCCGIELQDGTASGVTMTGNTVIGNADSGMSATGLTSGAGPNLIANNTVTDNGRFGIEVKLPNGTGSSSGDGSIVVEENTVSLTGTPADLRDWAGIAVFRRGFLVSEGNADIPTGVIVRNNTVSGYQQTNASSFSDGFGIVVEGLNMQVLNNTLEDNDVGVQVQAGHTPYNPNAAGDGDQNNLDDDYFGRGNSPIVCALVDSNTYTDNDVDYRVVGANASDSASIHNETAGTYQCTIQQAIDLASDGDTISVPAGTYEESISVYKDDLTLLGPNAGLDPNVDTRVAEAIIQPTTWYGIYITASGVTLDGFTLDGQDTCAYGIYMYTTTGADELLVTNNIIKNITTMGFLGWVQSGPASSQNLVSHNLFEGMPQRAIVALWNYYANVTDNVIRETGVGIYAENANQPEATGTVVWSDNTISTSRSGIWYNLAYNTATPLTISGNTLTAEDDPAGLRWDAFWLTSLGGSLNPTISDNTIIGSSITQITSGYHMWNNTTSAVGGITIQGGSVTDVDYGVWINNFEGYPTATGSNGGNTVATIDQVTITNAAVAGIYLHDNPSNTNAATVYAEVYNSTIIDSAIGILLDGEDASAKANNNRIYDNTEGVQNNSGNVMDATYNWWGTNYGPLDEIGSIEVPADPKPAVADMLNIEPAGMLGNPVSEDVDYFLWSTAPYVVSIVRTDASPTNATSVDFTVTFSEDVIDVDVADFDLTTTGVAGAAITGVSGSGDTYTVAVSTGTGSGTIRLDIPDTATVENLGGYELIDLPFTDGEVYTIDKDTVNILTITRADASPTSAASVNFTVTYSKDVVGVDVADFALTTTGVAGAAITAVSGSGDTYTVAVSTGTGSGTIRLDVPVTATVEDPLGNELINLPFTDGEVYVIDKGEVTIISIKRTGATPTSAASVDFIVTFSKDVTGVDVSDFVVSHISPVSTLSATSVTGVTGSGSLYTVTVNTGTGNGALRLDVPVTATINDLLANPLSGLPYTDGETYFLARLQTFPDVESDYWAWAFIERLYAAGITSGYPDGTYRPANTVTRAEMAVFLLKGINGPDYFPPAVTEFSFSDIEDHWAANWIEALKEAGFTSGYPDGSYKPNSPVSRAEIAVFLLKAINGPDYSPPTPMEYNFPDIEGHWASDWIEALRASGLTGGYPDGTYRPDNSVTRAEIAVFIVKAFELP